MLVGGYGVVVYKAIEKGNKKQVAVKRMDLDEEEGIPVTTVREVSLLRELQHPNIVLYIKFFLFINILKIKISIIWNLLIYSDRTKLAVSSTIITYSSVIIFT